jgi:glyoxylase-like metal-dependent hydrolase (beta-lactamase superfamily II)
VVTSEQVRALIPEVHKKRTSWFYERYKPDYPRETPDPESFGAQTTELEAGGVKVTAHVLGPGCSGAHVAVEFDGHLFVGDLIANQNHAWLELGLIDAWKQRIEELKALHPKFVHPGRGPTGGPELLDAQAAYLDRVVALVKAESPNGDPNPAAVERVEKALEAEYPNYGYAHFLELGLPAVWHSLAH